MITKTKIEIWEELEKIIKEEDFSPFRSVSFKSLTEDISVNLVMLCYRAFLPKIDASTREVFFMELHQKIPLVNAVSIRSTYDLHNNFTGWYEILIYLGASVKELENREILQENKELF